MGEALWQHLQGDVATQLGIARAIDLPCPRQARTEEEKRAGCSERRPGS
jgi:hypothetical protein